MPFSENIIVLYATSVLCTSFSSSTYPTIFSNDLFTCLSLWLVWKQSEDDFVSHSALYLVDIQKMFWMIATKDK